MSKSKIEITMEDGSVWSVRVSDIARHRDDYYERDVSVFFFSEYPDKAIDWFQNNTNWGDIEAVKIKEAPEPDYSDFRNCEMKLI